MKARHAIPTIAAVLVCFWARPAYANVVIAGMDAAVLGVFISVFVGGLEGLLLVWWFKAEPGRALVLMVLANIASTLLGLILAIPWRMAISLVFGSQLIYWMGPAAVITLIAAFVCTVLAEWPFCHFILTRVRRLGLKVMAQDVSVPALFRPLKAIMPRFLPDMAKSSLTASFVVQMASYAMILVVALGTGGMTFLGGVKADRSLVLRTADDATIYFLTSDGRVGSVRINGAKQHIMPIKSAGLFLARESPDKDWSLMGATSLMGISTNGEMELIRGWHGPPRVRCR